MIETNRQLLCLSPRQHKFIQHDSALCQDNWVEKSTAMPRGRVESHKEIVMTETTMVDEEGTVILCEFAAPAWAHLASGASVLNLPESWNTSHPVN
jgi:hypothetical protein